MPHPGAAECAQTRYNSGAQKKMLRGAENRLEGEARRMIDGGRVAEGKLQRIFVGLKGARCWSEEQSREQLRPFRYRYHESRCRSQGHEWLPRTTRSLAGTGLIRRRQLVLGNDRSIRRKIDMSGIIATSAGGGRRKESECQTCQRDAGGKSSQTWRRVAHQEIHKRDTLPIFLILLFCAAIASKKQKKRKISSTAPRQRKIKPALASASEQRSPAYEAAGGVLHRRTD